jgi:hypothetical protein
MKFKKKLLTLLVVFFIILTIIIFCGCITSIDKIILDEDYYHNAPRDPVTINDVKIIKDLLYLNVSYSGGCEEHIFTLIAAAFMESNPVQVNVLLSHEDNNDPCEMWITQDLFYNLKPLKRAWQRAYNKISGTIIINLQDYDETLYYNF